MGCGVLSVLGEGFVGRSALPGEAEIFQEPGAEFLA
jgi:hypothetical protein